jgi:Ca-activated chloride channel family protein
MQFEHPEILWLLLLALPGLIAFFWWAAKTRRRLAAQFIAARLLPNLLAGFSPGRQKARAALLVAAMVLLLVALARPQIGFSWEEARSRGLDVVVAIDTSKSMLAADVAPNRLRRAQLAALDLKRLARTDRLGLVAFAGSAFLQCPLTLDDEVFRQSVEALDVNIIPVGGSALAEAIHAARGAFKEGNDNHKVLVLFSDGEDNDGSAAEAARAAGKDGLRIFTVGVGTPNGELLRTTDTQGRTEFIKDEDGNVVKSRLNEALLKEMAQEAGGFYLNLAGANTMSTLYERGLAPLPKSDLASQRIKRHHERYQWLLGLVIVLLLVEMLLPERPSVKAVGDAAVAASVPAVGANGIAGKAVTLGFLLLAPEGLWASAGNALRDYREGNFALAQTAYENLLLKKPGDARLHYNAGTAAFQGANYTTALLHFTAALTNADLTLQQRAYYNLGNTHFRLGEALEEGDFEGRQKRWEEALKTYQNAVALNTNDVDAAFNRQFVANKLQELKDLLRLRDEARKAKRRADDAVSRREYSQALRFMAPAMTNQVTAKEFEDYVQRLQQIDEINNPRQP